MIENQYIHGIPDRDTMAPPPVPIDPSLGSWHHSDPSRPDLEIAPFSSDRLAISRDRRRSITDILNEANIDPSTQAVGKSSQGPDIEPDPLLRFWNEKGDPWSSQRIGGSSPNEPSGIMDQHFRGNYIRPRRSLTQYDAYQASLRSEGEGSNPAFPADSGYASKSIATRSVPSVGYASQSYERQSLPGDAASFGLAPDETAFYPAPPLAQSPYAPVQPTAEETFTAPRTESLFCQYPDCGVVSKNHSEAR